MPSEHRLHPSSVLFGLAAQAKNLAVPGLLVLFGANRAGAAWEPWLMLFLVPYTGFALVRYLSFRYRYEPNEIVIRTGLLFRNERHVPYARIQNLDAVQTIAHRLLGVVEVRVQTGGGNEPEVTLSVVPLAALEEMRRRVFEGRGGAPAAGEPEVDREGVPAASRGWRLILRLPPRELLLAGFIENRGVVLIGAAFGVLWELGFIDPLFERIFGEDASGRGIMRELAIAVFAGAGLSLRRVAITLAAFAGVLVFIRLLSMVWAVVRLYGFQLTRDGNDLRAEFGLLTRISATIPLGRIQTLTIRQGPLHRLFDRVAVKVETAGGHGGEDREGVKSGDADRTWLAPIVRPADLPAVLREVLPEVDVAALEWQGVHPRAFRRAFRSWLVFAVPIVLALSIVVQWWTPLLLAAVVAWAYIDARQFVRHVGWAETGAVVVLRTGWIWRRTTVARFAKIQAVSLDESPFDRRHRMAVVAVDTAGGGEDRVRIPFLGRDVAGGLYVRLAAEAARTEFKW